jgi:sporulation protein YlmC with PRC-barrel domain
MTPDSMIKLVSELLDLPLIDSEGKYCGVVDDIEFTGGPGKDAKLKALLVGPGAYAGRLPSWALWLVEKLAGDRITRVPMDNAPAATSACTRARSRPAAGCRRRERSDASVGPSRQESAVARRRDPWARARRARRQGQGHGADVRPRQLHRASDRQEGWSADPLGVREASRTGRDYGSVRSAAEEA